MHFSDFFVNLINGLAGHSNTLDTIMILISKTTPYILMIITLTIYFLGLFKGNDKLKLTAVNTVIKTFVAIIISQVIGQIIPLSRPFVNNENIKLLYPHEANASFPSDHSLGCMSIAFGLSRYNSKFNKLYIGLAILTGFSRIYVGHHYPLDVLGGFIIAIVVGRLYDRCASNVMENIYLKIERLLKIDKIKKTC